MVSYYIRSGDAHPSSAQGFFSQTCSAPGWLYVQECHITLPRSSCVCTFKEGPSVSLQNSFMPIAPDIPSISLLYVWVHVLIQRALGEQLVSRSKLNQFKDSLPVSESRALDKTILPAATKSRQKTVAERNLRVQYYSTPEEHQGTWHDHQT